MITAFKQHWKIYTMEAVCLGIFMISASVFATLLEYPESPVHTAIPDSRVRLCLMGVAMGVTAIGIIYSPMGKLSGAHMNPAVTLSFVALGKIKPTDAFFYVTFQLIGGVVAIEIMSIIIGIPFQDEHINYVVTVPGKSGTAVAFVTEFMMAFGMMLVVLVTSNDNKLAKHTGLFAGILVASYVILSAPISGFSINPARTLASAIPSGIYSSLWIYMIAPFIGMFSAATAFRAIGGRAICAKLTHIESYSCIFNCGYCKHQVHQPQTNRNYYGK